MINPKIIPEGLESSDLIHADDFTLAPTGNLQSSIAITSRVRCRHALVQHCLSYYKRHSEIEKKELIITRTNGTTKRKETYKTERPDKYATNAMVKLLDIWCRLRTYAGTTGLIKERVSKMVDLASVCECSINKLRPALKELHRMDWIHMDEQVIALRSEKHVYAISGLDYQRKIDRTFTKPNKIQNEKQTHYWLYVADIDDNRKRQAYVFHQKIITNPELRVWLYSYMQSQGHTIAQAERDPALVARVLNDLYRDSFQGRESEMFDYLVENRPDVNRGVTGMASAWSTCPQNVSYIKKMLIRQCLAFVQKIGTISSTDFKHNKFCRVMYNFKDKATFQAFCDDIVPRKEFHPSELKQFQQAAA